MTTSVTTAAITGGESITGKATTANPALVSGAVSADAVQTTATASLVGTTPSSSGGTTFTNLKVGGKTVPLTVPKNTTIPVPGVASVTLNYVASQPAPGNSYIAAAAAVVTLLTAQSSLPAGSVIYINPVIVRVKLVGPLFRPVGEYGFATKVTTTADNQASAGSGATGATGVPMDGTGGAVISNNTVGADVSSALSDGAVGSTSSGLTSDTISWSTTTASVNGLSMLGGLITATWLPDETHAQYVVL